MLTPEYNQNARRGRQLRCRKQRFYVAGVELRQFPHSNCLCRCVHFSTILIRTSNKYFSFLEVCHSKITAFSIDRSHSVCRGYSLFVSPATHQILGTLLDVEDEEPKEPHHHHDPAHSKQVITPALIRRCRTWCRCRGTREVTNQWPSNLV